MTSIFTTIQCWELTGWIFVCWILHSLGCVQCFGWMPRKKNPIEIAALLQRKEINYWCWCLINFHGMDTFFGKIHDMLVSFLASFLCWELVGTISYSWNFRCSCYHRLAWWVPCTKGADFQPSSQFSEKRWMRCICIFFISWITLLQFWCYRWNWVLRLEHFWIQ